jgi:double-stranded uracil-DNA glycosylase
VTTTVPGDDLAPPLTASSGRPGRPRRDTLPGYAGATVADLVGAGPRLLFVGINPGLWTAATQTHFAHPSNRFYPALYRAGLTPIELDPAAGLTTAEQALLHERGIAITNLVARATARASELAAEELRAGAARLLKRIEAWRPRVVAVAGVTSYRIAFRRPRAAFGPQPERIGDAALWVVPNPSGLNAHETVASLAGWYGAAARAAGIPSVSPG